MLKYIVSLLLVICILSPIQFINAQGYKIIQDSAVAPCQLIKLNIDETKTKILNSFINNTEKHNYFINNMGIIELRIYTNEEGLLCWLLIPHIDDSYKHDPPNKFAEFSGDIILIYDADIKGNKIKIKSPQDYLKCLDYVIGNRVYQTHERTDRWSSIEYTTGKGIKLRQGKDRKFFGNSGEVIIIFQKDGTYKTIAPG